MKLSKEYKLGKKKARVLSSTKLIYLRVFYSVIQFDFCRCKLLQDSWLYARHFAARTNMQNNLTTVFQVSVAFPPPSPHI